MKSKRNRVLPVPEVVRAEVLMRYTGNRKYNLFTLDEAPYNRDYFKTLWSRYKRQSSLLKETKPCTASDTQVQSKSLRKQALYLSYSKLWDIAI